MEISVRKLSPALGAEITGVDLRGDLDDAVFGQIRATWLENQVIVIRGQSLDADQQTAFVRRMGPVQPIRTLQNEGGRSQDYMYVANRSYEGMKGVLPDGEMQFHADQCYYENPSRATTLHAIEVPSKGGNTMFANCYLAYENLPEATKHRIAGLNALNIYDYDANATIKAKESAPDAPRFVHPVVIRHPETGRPVLFVNRLMTHRIVELEAAESDALLEQLFRAGEDRSIVYEHVWVPGDLVMWDNMCTLHARTDFDPVERRIMRRVTVAGARPEPAFARAA